MRHVTDADMEQLLSGRLEPAETRDLLRHLLSRCRFCRRHWVLVAEILGEEDGVEGNCTALEDSKYDAAIDRAFAAARASIPHWQEESARMETLLHAIPAERYRNPRQMLLLAVKAEEQARRLRESALYPPALAADMHARALGELANAQRINEQLAAANELLVEAAATQSEGTGDAFVLARLHDIGSSLRRDQRRLSEAIEALDGSWQLYREIGETHLAGRALINKGICTAHLCRYSEATEILQEGLELIDPARDPQLVAIGLYCYILSLSDCGEHLRASELLLKSGLRELFAAEPLNLLKLRWLEGRIHAGLGRLRKAETALTAARQGFSEKTQSYDAALVGLDLLGVWLRQGMAVEAQELAGDVLEAFLDLGIQSEALKALRYLREACRRRAATPTLVKLVADFLRQLEWQPLLRFAPAGR